MEGWILVRKVGDDSRIPTVVVAYFSHSYDGHPRTSFKILIIKYIFFTLV